MTTKNYNLVKERDWKEVEAIIRLAKADYAVKMVKEYVEAEKQLSYQEGVENCIKVVRQRILASDPVKEILKELRHQLSNLKEEKL